MQDTQNLLKKKEYYSEAIERAVREGALPSEIAWEESELDRVTRRLERRAKNRKKNRKQFKKANGYS